MSLLFADTEAGSEGPVAAAPLQVGTIQFRHLTHDEGLGYFIFLPSGELRADMPLLVAVHGVSRNADEHMQAFAELAQARGALLVAPLFTKARFHDYQRLGRLGRGPRADLALHRILDEVHRLSGVRTERLHLFGFSGGAQFAHRYLMAHPERVASAVISSAGWYTLPSDAHAYPLGTGAPMDLPGVRFEAEKYLQVPVTVLIGERDDELDFELNQTRRINRTQGDTRLARARSWVQAMSRAALAQGLPSRVRLQTLPRTGHSFRQAVRRGGLVEQAASAWFDAPGCADAGECVPPVSLTRAD